MAQKQIPQELKNRFKNELAELQKKLGVLSITVQQIKSSGINVELVEYAVLRSVKKQYSNVNLTTKDIRMVLQGIYKIDEYLSDMSGWEQ